jgi:stage II sporulation protein AA (anti-sigma F factor antagonist)
MAKNFRIIFSEKNNRLIQIQLHGDFDGTSAHELINTLRKYLAIYPAVAIDTEGLKSINTFGLNVLSTRLKSLRRPHARIAFSGRYQSVFITE